MSRPAIFISSTIYDFGDMRSALKDYIEERGCKVFLSEFADFPRPLNKHSYEECLNTIEQAQLFVLLVGRRSGGWYNEKARISITRAEFEHAVKLAKAGRIRILTFVRKDVLDHHQSCKSLRKTLLADATLDDAKRNTILYHPTETMDKPQAIIEFIDAIARNHETAAAAKGIGKPPISNWITPFLGFAEIRQAIEPLITGGFEVGIAAGRKALEGQLLVVLRSLLSLQTLAARTSPDIDVRALAGQIDLGADKGSNFFRVEHGAFKKLLYFAFASAGARPDPGPLAHALASNLLMKLDRSGSQFHATPEYDLLVHIVTLCHVLKETRDRSEALSTAGAHFAKGQAVSLPREDVEEQMLRLIGWADLIVAARSLACSLRGGTCPIPLPSADASLPNMATTVPVTFDDIRAYVDALSSR